MRLSAAYAVAGLTEPPPAELGVSGAVVSVTNSNGTFRMKPLRGAGDSIDLSGARDESTAAATTADAPFVFGLCSNATFVDPSAWCLSKDGTKIMPGTEVVLTTNEQLGLWPEIQQGASATSPVPASVVMIVSVDDARFILTYPKSLNMSSAKLVACDSIADVQEEQDEQRKKRFTPCMNLVMQNGALYGLVGSGLRAKVVQDQFSQSRSLMLDCLAGKIRVDTGDPPPEVLLAAKTAADEQMRSMIPLQDPGEAPPSSMSESVERVAVADPTRAEPLGDGVMTPMGIPNVMRNPGGQIAHALFGRGPGLFLETSSVQSDEPVADEGGSSVGLAATDMLQEIRQWLATHDPDDRRSVEAGNTLARSKYLDEARSALEDFYEAVAPEKLPNVPAIVQIYITPNPETNEDRVEELTSELIQRYGRAPRLPQR